MKNPAQSWLDAKLAVSSWTQPASTWLVSGSLGTQSYYCYNVILHVSLQSKISAVQLVALVDETRYFPIISCGELISVIDPVLVSKMLFNQKKQFPVKQNHRKHFIWWSKSLACSMNYWTTASPPTHNNHTRISYDIVYYLWAEDAQPLMQIS